MTTPEESIHSRQYLTFSLREENYAIEIDKVREVLDVTVLTKIPRMPDYLCGIINLRGNVVPVMDLGLRLGLPQIDHTRHTCIIIVEIGCGEESGSVHMGLVTDSVRMVVNMRDDEIEFAPKMGTNLNTDFIRGMGKQDENKFIIILDIDTILTTEAEDLREMDFTGAALDLEEQAAAGTAEQL